MCTQTTDGYSDEKNVRRRVYDALNVLKAADIIVQGPGRDLMWRGMPNRSGAQQDDASGLHELRTRKRALLEQTKRQLDNVVVRSKRMCLECVVLQEQRVCLALPVVVHTRHLHSN